LQCESKYTKFNETPEKRRNTLYRNPLVGALIADFFKFACIFKLNGVPQAVIQERGAPRGDVLCAMCGIEIHPVCRYTVDILDEI
jgi:hypothetical protein